MKPGGYPVDSGVVPFDPGMGAAPTGIEYPGGAPNVIQDYMEGDAGMYDGLPNQKLVNEAAMEVFKKGFRNANWDMPQGSPAQLNPEPLTFMMPDPANDLFVSNNNIINSDLAPEFQNLVTQVGINEKQKNLIDQAINNAQMSGTKIPPEIFDQAKNLDTKAESGFLGTDWGATEADPMTQQEYKDYLVSKGYI